MSRYGMDKVIWEVTRTEDDSSLNRFLDDPAAYVQSYDLTAEERDALIARDIGTLYRLGAHPFMLPGFAMKVTGVESRDADRVYLESIKEHGYPDFST